MKASTNQTNTNQKWLNTKQAAQILNVHERTIENWRREGLKPLRFFKVGQVIRYRERDLFTFLEEHMYDHLAEYHSKNS